MNNKKRIAINMGSGFIPGMNTAVAGAVIAAEELGWEIVGILDGFDGLLYPDKYPDGGLLTLDRRLADNLELAGSGILGQAPRVDPFHVRQVNEDGLVEEADLSDQLLERLKMEKIDAVISVFGGRGMSILYKLHRKGLNTVCIPRSIENDIAATRVSFGFNTALSFTIEMLDRVRQAAISARKIGVVEVSGAQSGWLALQAGVAVLADAILIPEIPGDLKLVAEKLKEITSTGRPYGLVVVAEGARLIEKSKRQTGEPAPNPLKDSLSPLAGDETGEHVIRRSGHAATTVAKQLQLLLPEETYPMVLGPWVRGGSPTALDRQLGLLYGAGAVEALKKGETGSVVAFIPPEISFVPLSQAINKVRRLTNDNEFVKIAKTLKISLGGEL